MPPLSQNIDASSALELGARKRPSTQDPLVHYGRHFGRSIHAFCNIHTLLTKAIARASNSSFRSTRSTDDQWEETLYRKLLAMVPKLEERLMTASVDELQFISTMLQKGMANARADDTKSLKGAVIDWLTPRGVALDPPLHRNSKVDRGFNHDITGRLLCPANIDWKNKEIRHQLQSGEYIVPGDQWPILLFADYEYDPDDPWKGLLRSKILVKAYKHIFTSPSSVDREIKATRSGNARIHGMTAVTIPSLAYAATQLRFALTSSPVFSRNDVQTDSQRFYNSLVGFLEDPEEKREVEDLLNFWNRQVFPEYACVKRTSSENSVLARLRQKRAAAHLTVLRERGNNSGA